jgi:hypothetical protein
MKRGKGNTEMNSLKETPRKHRNEFPHNRLDAKARERGKGN